MPGPVRSQRGEDRQVAPVVRARALPMTASFYDVSGITENPEVFQLVVDFFVERYRAQGANGPTHIAGFDARGFLFGPPIALALKIPFVMIRKAGKLPASSFPRASTSPSTARTRPSCVWVPYPRAIAWCWWTISSPPVAPPSRVSISWTCSARRCTSSRRWCRCLSWTASGRFTRTRMANTRT